MFLVPALAALIAPWRSPAAVTSWHSTRLDAAWRLTILTLTLLIGFRFQVGGDWGNYLRQFDETKELELAAVLAKSDPGYHLLNWLSAQAGWGIYGVNLVCGVIYSVGLAVFCLSLPRPWLALTVSVPYLLLVLAMGYSRQGVALGLAMLGLVALGRKSTVRFVWWVALGASFHHSALILLPIAALASTRNRYWTLVWVGMLGLGAYVLLLQQNVDQLFSTYVDGRVQSSGALIRLLMNAVPAVVLLLWRRSFVFTEAERRLWIWFAILSLVLLGLVVASPATTAVDRIALYLLPLQLVVFSHLPEVFGLPGRRNEDLVWVVLLYYGAVLYIWLNFAVNSFYWIPYRFYLFESGV
jgi:hypothetical protein